MEKFWMVWCENGGQPTYKHSTPALAEQEAARLKRKYRDKEFFVLEAMTAAVIEDTPIRHEALTMPGLPF